MLKHIRFKNYQNKNTEIFAQIYHHPRMNKAIQQTNVNFCLF